MSFPNQLHLDSIACKRLSSSDLALRSRSFQISIPRPCSELPLEIWELVALNLKGCDLKRLSEVSLKCKVAALGAKNLQEMHGALKEIQTLGNLNLNLREEDSSPVIRTYLKILAITSRDGMPNEFPGLQIHVEALKEFKLKLSTFSTQRVAREFLALSQNCFKQIDANRASLESIENKYLSKKLRFVTQALCYLIDATLDPNLTRGFAVATAAREGFKQMVQDLLEHGAIYDEERNAAFQQAAQKGYLDVLQALTANQEISSEYLQGLFAWQAVKQGHVDGVRDCLKNGSIADNFSEWIVNDIARIGNLALLLVFLERGAVCVSTKSAAALEAARHGHLQIVQALMPIIPCNTFFRGRLMLESARSGHFEIVQFLLTTGKISEESRGQILALAAQYGHLEVVQELLASGSISEIDHCNAIGKALLHGQKLIYDLIRHHQFQYCFAQKLKAL